MCISSSARPMTSNATVLCPVRGLIICIITILTNSIVFLRALDYFQGILFLTTNRVGHFDEAFMSRIHLSLGYEPLTEESRNTIWDNLFDKLEEDYKRGGPQIDYAYHAKSFAQSPQVQVLGWNGREIRNGKLDQ